MGEAEEGELPSGLESQGDSARLPPQQGAELVPKTPIEIFGSKALVKKTQGTSTGWFLGIGENSQNVRCLMMFNDVYSIL